MNIRPIIDAGPGLNFFSIHKERLLIGELNIASTQTVLARAAGSEHLPDKTSMRDTYRRLRKLDDGLPPIETTSLLTPSLWR